MAALAGAHRILASQCQVMRLRVWVNAGCSVEVADPKELRDLCDEHEDALECAGYFTSAVNDAQS